MRLSHVLALTAILLTLLAGGGAGPGPASAQGRVGTRRMGVRWNDSVPHLTFSVRDMVTADVRRKLASGLPQNLIMSVFAYRDGGGRALAVAPRSCRVVYDLWEEVYRVEVQTESVDRTYTVTRVREVVERCLVARGIRVGRKADYEGRRGSRVYFAALVEFNPLSPATVQRIRRWLARPSGRVESEAFFGSFVSLFVNQRIGQAERSIRFRSQTLEVPR